MPDGAAAGDASPADGSPSSSAAARPPSVSTSGTLPEEVAKSVTRGDSATLARWLNASDDNHIDSRDAKGRTLLMLSVAVGHRGIVMDLVRRGANLELKQRQGTTALMFACYSGDIGLVKALVQARARLDQAEAAAKTHDEALVVLTTEVHAKCSSEEVKLG